MANAETLMNDGELYPRARRTGGPAPFSLAIFLHNDTNLWLTAMLTIDAILIGWFVRRQWKRRV